MRGEYMNAIIDAEQQLGSPPHARRILLKNLASATMMGITSACAENTCASTGKRIQLRDHLRMRGEYSVNSLPSNAKKGSPPHARRIHGGNGKGTLLERITSACAENTDGKWPCSSRFGDHLRMRGEYRD
ncbi:hypothetical protein FD04_GL001333 [Secundilactobacillus odoratitofui DSM 19909 = JCM 15043]|uniref:Uncharacterized protein n=1 Tax=Secundilactobacillus odoratitofui DSM 19909 = JCM 15043 TaxID=1423776 RepID=A0A0R1LZZ2_9LACO|nr:hypothetical protein FD04_GL001333 [Secundilactobacillus odoratitofui DSM 19909 = JCM 15043]